MLKGSALIQEMCLLFVIILCQLIPKLFIVFLNLHRIFVLLYITFLLFLNHYLIYYGNIPLHFGVEKLNAFEKIRNKLIDRHILCLFNPKAETQLHYDASSLGFGFILQPDDIFHPIFYSSQRTSDVESRYHIL